MIRPLDVVIGLDVPPPTHKKKALWHPSVFLFLQSDTVVVRDPAGILTAYACQANVFEACMRIHHHHLYCRGVTHDLGGSSRVTLPRDGRTGPSATPPLRAAGTRFL